MVCVPKPQLIFLLGKESFFSSLNNEGSASLLLKIINYHYRFSICVSGVLILHSDHSDPDEAVKNFHDSVCDDHLPIRTMDGVRRVICNINWESSRLYYYGLGFPGSIKAWLQPEPE